MNLNTVNQINAKKRALLAKFEKDQKEKRLKWFENVGAGDFSVLEEMIISKNANINWIDDKVNVGGSEDIKYVENFTYRFSREFGMFYSKT